MDQSDMERTRRHVDAQGLVDLARELIRIPSFSPDETPVARFLAIFRQRGYDVDLQEVEPGRFQTIATLRGAADGMPDVQWPPRHQLPHARRHARSVDARVEGNRLYGHGVQNMKGGVAAMISAAEAVRPGNHPPRRPGHRLCRRGDPGRRGNAPSGPARRAGGRRVLPEPFGIGTS